MRIPVWPVFFGLTVIAAVFYIAATGTHNWRKQSGTELGLWKICFSGGTCLEVDVKCKVSGGTVFPKSSACDAYQGARALSVLSIISACLGVMAFAAKYCFTNREKTLVYTSLVLIIISSKSCNGA